MSWAYSRTEFPPAFVRPLHPRAYRLFCIIVVLHLCVCECVISPCKHICAARRQKSQTRRALCGSVDMRQLRIYPLAHPPATHRRRLRMNKCYSHPPNQGADDAALISANFLPSSFQRCLATGLIALLATLQALDDVATRQHGVLIKNYCYYQEVLYVER